MTSDNDGVGADTSRRRDRTYTSVMRATAELLREVGVRSTTAEAIASRAGVSRATLYKWWPNKTAVAIEAFATHMSEAVHVPDTGRARDDIVRQLQEVAAFFSGSNGRILAQLVAEAQSTPEAMRDLQERFFVPRRAAVLQLWNRGVAQGEFRSDIDPELAIDLIYGPVVYRLLAGALPLTVSELPGYVDVILAGLGTRPPANS
jgi:AcrR family transcriptional regulator